MKVKVFISKEGVERFEEEKMVDIIINTKLSFEIKTTIYIDTYEMSIMQWDCGTITELKHYYSYGEANSEADRYTIELPDSLMATLNGLIPEEFIGDDLYEVDQPAYAALAYKLVIEEVSKQTMK
jgi:hypothetical protein